MHNQMNLLRDPWAKNKPRAPIVPHSSSVLPHLTNMKQCVIEHGTVFQLFNIGKRFLVYTTQINIQQLLTFLLTTNIVQSRLDPNLITNCPKQILSAKSSQTGQHCPI